MNFILYISCEGTGWTRADARRRAGAEEVIDD